MKKPIALAKRLEQEYSRRLDCTTRAVLEEPPSENLKGQVDWLKQAESILSVRKPWWARKPVTIGLGLLCLVAIGIAMKPRGQTAIQMDIVSKGVELHLARDWRVSDWPDATHLEIDNLVHIRALNCNPTVDFNREEVGSPGRLEVTGTKMQLDELSLARGAQVFLDSGPNSLTLVVKGVPIRGNIQGGSIIEPADSQCNSEPPETIEFASIAAKENPVRIITVSTEPWTFFGLVVDEVDFAEERAVSWPESKDGRQISLVSTIQSGTLRLLETGEKIEMQPGDFLKLDKLRTTRVTLSKHEGDIRTVLEATATRILVGPENFTQDVTPTWLEYLYNNQELALIYGAVVFVWSAIWSLWGFFKTS